MAQNKQTLRTEGDEIRMGFIWWTRGMFMVVWAIMYATGSEREWMAFCVVLVLTLVLKLYEHIRPPRYRTGRQWVRHAKDARY